MRWLIDSYVLDVWSLVHFMFFFLFICRRNTSRSLTGVLFMTALMTGTWEMIESGTGFLQGDFGGEPWQNRWISDPVFNTLGTLVGFYLQPIIFRKHGEDSI